MVSLKEINVVLLSGTYFLQETPHVLLHLGGLRQILGLAICNNFGWDLFSRLVATVHECSAEIHKINPQPGQYCPPTPDQWTPSHLAKGVKQQELNSHDHEGLRAAFSYVMSVLKRDSSLCITEFQ